MAKKRKNLLIFGHYGLPNWGDEAILSGFLQRLDQQQWNITIVSPFSDFIAEQYDLDSVAPPPSGTLSWLKAAITGSRRATNSAIKKADFILFGGGGLFQEQPPRALKIWNAYLKKCVRMKKKVLIVANSIGPFLSARSQQKTERLFQNTSFFSVRDEASYELLEAMDIPEERRSLGSDAAFLLPEKRKVYSKRRGVVFALRNGDLSAREVEELKKFCTFLKKKKQSVQFLAMQSRQSNDELLAKKLDIPVIIPESLEHVRDVFTNARYVVANRLHGCILSMLSTTPFLALATRPKITHFLQSADLEELLFEKKITNRNLQKVYTAFVKNRVQMQKDIRRAVKREKEKAKFLLPDFF